MAGSSQQYVGVPPHVIGVLKCYDAGNANTSIAMCGFKYLAVELVEAVHELLAEGNLIGWNSRPFEGTYQSAWE